MNSIEKLAVSLGALDMIRHYLVRARAGTMTAADAMAEIESIIATWDRACAIPAARGQA